MVKKCYAENIREFGKWFDKNHEKEDKVKLISYKKHTGKPSLSHRDSMEVAICYGWIDTIVKRIDEDKFMRTFVKRKPNAGWSVNTLSYAKDMIKEGRMKPEGLIAYNLGKKKGAFDPGRLKNPKIPDDLKKALVKEKMLDDFKNLSPSQKKYILYWMDSGKRQETRDKRIKIIIDKIKKNERVF
jgi:uncharacterized protein YdeI (YjbR/CyaY-like superfamily)